MKEIISVKLLFSCYLFRGRMDVLILRVVLIAQLFMYVLCRVRIYFAIKFSIVLISPISQYSLSYCHYFIFV